MTDDSSKPKKLVGRTRLAGDVFTNAINEFVERIHARPKRRGLVTIPCRSANT